MPCFGASPLDFYLYAEKNSENAGRLAIGKTPLPCRVIRNVDDNERMQAYRETRAAGFAGSRDSAAIIHLHFARESQDNRRRIFFCARQAKGTVASFCDTRSPNLCWQHTATQLHWLQAKLREAASEQTLYSDSDSFLFFSPNLNQQPTEPSPLVHHSRTNLNPVSWHLSLILLQEPRSNPWIFKKFYAPLGS
jgi:hypothetical protein